MRTEHFDLIVLGAGSAARDGASKAKREHGANVAMIERERWGGSGPNVACRDHATPARRLGFLVFAGRLHVLIATRGVRVTMRGLDYAGARAAGDRRSHGWAEAVWLLALLLDGILRRSGLTLGQGRPQDQARRAGKAHDAYQSAHCVLLACARVDSSMCGQRLQSTCPRRFIWNRRAHAHTTVLHRLDAERLARQGGADSVIDSRCRGSREARASGHREPSVPGHEG